MPADVIPRFFLYGEPPRTVSDRFLHLEALDDRSRPAHWNIRPHSHANLNHVFHIAEGSGEMRAESETTRFTAPCLLLVPAGIVHGFDWEAETRGDVLTLSEVYLQDLASREPGFRSLFLSAGQIALSDSCPFTSLFERLGRELAWSAPGHAAAVEALLVTLMVDVLRLSQLAGEAQRTPPGAAAVLVARFRELVEARYRTDAGIEAYAEALAVTPKRLRSACLKRPAFRPCRSSRTGCCSRPSGSCSIRT